ncbi:hypothetical protein DACRYDRAFT_23443 [Dacryopinax primogenitus]|uniref:Uncharacterized protein n=1 Tax=Dacryopinax primogenitus (strain DJM 731) TaxID=1858805 RepID=M5G1W5_DACPD|nr:uncharacterized protein DACRYDRAFT_23443 [Dacryopinax primogenitus]EJT99891.1 hypothetical protein DACRYDRAFT_23443 [Dacryopinax primogenitus]
MTTMRNPEARSRPGIFSRAKHNNATVRAANRWVGDKFPEEPSEDLPVQLRLDVSPDILQAQPDMPSHVYMVWVIGTMMEHGVQQVVERRVHLTGSPGDYAHYTDDIRAVEAASTSYTELLLGNYTALQRKRILTLAEDVPFSPHWARNTCKTWMWLLLSAMNTEGLLNPPLLAGTTQETAIADPRENALGQQLIDRLVTGRPLWLRALAAEA